MLMTEWYLVYSDYDGPTYRVVRPLYDWDGNQESWVDQNGVHTAVYKDDKVMQISDPTQWKNMVPFQYKPEVTSYRVMMTSMNPVIQIGTVHKETDGWRFIPWTDAHKPSRKGWPIPKAAIPRWVGPFKLEGGVV